MPNYKLTINQQKVTVSVEPEMPLLWVLRDYLGLTGTKFGCGLGVCGACTILQGNQSVRA
ncbi:MAG TPA: 2Fe-2S iron-sulfur cluster-binding protein, partial [Acidobacteriota bacterium]|nr:2Fe-2S iron-sulfur cluster-binding protein [Acidobacteriota bacterium]